MISIFQIYFDEESEKQLDPAFYPYKNRVKDEFFESSVIRQVYEMNPDLKKGVKYLGVTSWKQELKSHSSASELIEYIEQDIAAGVEKDIYLYSALQGVVPKYDKEKERFHGTINDCSIWHAHLGREKAVNECNTLLNSSGVLPFDLFDGKWQYVYCNYWIAKPHVFDEYCKKALIPAMDFFMQPAIMDSLPKFYEHRHEKRKTTAICFPLEGLFGSFVANNNYSFDYICRKKIKGTYQPVHIDGYNMINK